MGSRKRYDGPIFSETEVINFVSEFQKSYAIFIPPVRIAPTHYIHCDYKEAGWEMVVINYPKYDMPIKMLEHFMVKLAEALLEKFDQNKVSVVFPNEIYVFEKDNAQQYECFC
jgi:hypothetical protein